jgi:hypothetical protein
VAVKRYIDDEWVTISGLQGPVGETGLRGEKGDTGDTGAAGATGATGPANTLSIGTVTNGEIADASITGSSPNQTLNLVLPLNANAVITNDYQTLTNKTIQLGNNNVSGTLEQFNSALTGADFASLAGAETLTNKTLTSPKINENVVMSATATELNVLDGITSTTAELNILDGATLSVTELNYVTGVTSAIQTQLNDKASATSISDATTTTAARGAGYMGIPQSSAATTGAYTIVAADAGEHIYSTATRTVTIPANASVAFPVGTAITFIAATGTTVTIAITTDTLLLAGAGTTGSRTLAPFGMATAIKITSTSWIISGNGLT